MGTHYDTLGIRPDADQRAIRVAYLAKARAHHPDRHVGEPPADRARAARTMREVNAAWAVLSDPVARRRYDESTTARPSPGTGATGTGAASPRTTSPPHAGPSNAGSGATGPGFARAGSAGAHGDADLVGRGIRLLPVLGIVALLLGIFVFTAFAATSDTEPSPTTVVRGDLAVGTCVRVSNVLAAVPCAERHDATVSSIVDIARGCPPGTAIYTLDRVRVACLRPEP